MAACQYELCNTKNANPATEQTKIDYRCMEQAISKKRKCLGRKRKEEIFLVVSVKNVGFLSFTA